MVCVCVCVCGGIRKGVCVWVGVGLCAGAGGGAGFTRRAEMACPANARRRQWQLLPWGSSPAAAGGGGGGWMAAMSMNAMSVSESDSEWLRLWVTQTLSDSDWGRSRQTAGRRDGSTDGLARVGSEGCRSWLAAEVGLVGAGAVPCTMVFAALYNSVWSPLQWESLDSEGRDAEVSVFAELSLDQVKMQEVLCKESAVVLISLSSEGRNAVYWQLGYTHNTGMPNFMDPDLDSEQSTCRTWKVCKVVQVLIAFKLCQKSCLLNWSST